MAIIIKKKAALLTPEPAPVKKPEVEKQVHGRVLDGMCRVVMSSCPNGVIPWWLIASYLYYIHDMSILSDGLYDEMARDMLARWDKLNHMHKHLITKGDLETGSLYRLKAEQYPGMTKGAAAHLVRGEWGVSIQEK